MFSLVCLCVCVCVCVYVHRGSHVTITYDALELTSPGPAPAWTTSGGHHWRPVQVCSLPDPPHPPPPPLRTYVEAGMVSTVPILLQCFLDKYNLISIICNGGLWGIYIGIFQFYLGMPLIFTDSQQCTWLRLTSCWKICEFITILENSNISHLTLI